MLAYNAKNFEECLWLINPNTPSALQRSLGARQVSASPTSVGIPVASQ